MPQFLLSVREHGAFSLGERTQITGKIFFFSIFRGFNKNRARGLVLLVGRIGLIHEGKTAALGSGVLSRAAPHTLRAPLRPRGDGGEGREAGRGRRGEEGRQVENASARPDQPPSREMGTAEAVVP